MIATAHLKDLPPETAAATTSTPMADVKTKLVELARKHGFESCRVAACSPPPHADKFDDWLSAGAHGEMEYMARGEEKRRDPQKILPGAKSVVVLALNYFQGVEAGVSPANRGAAGTAAITSTGRIARYAWGDDYHDVIAAKLNKIDI